MAKTLQEMLGEARKEVREAAPPEVRQKLQVEHALRLIDVREDDEWRAGHLPGAEHIARGVLEFRLTKAVPDKATELIFY